MPVLDSINTFKDSAQLALDSIQHRDSILRADSIARFDSIASARADSILRHSLSGFQGELPLGVPSDQNWVFLVLLTVFGLLVLSVIRSMTPPLDIFKTFFIAKERSSIFSKTSIDNFEQKFYHILISFIVIPLYGYLVYYQKGTRFEFLIYMYFTAALVAFFLIKYLLAKVLEFVFVEKSYMKMIFDSYLNVMSFVSIIFYILIFLKLYISNFSEEFFEISGQIILILALILLLIKLIQFFLHKIVDSLYIILYLCTLEILPVLFLVQAFRYLT
ncbi:MAG: DUF4271 domain-containing protein [Paludibacter sp.]